MRKIYIPRNDTAVIQFDILEAYDKNGNLLTSLTGYTAVFTVRNAIDSATVITQKTGTITGNKVLVRLDGTEFSSYADGSVLYADLELRGTDGTKTTVMVGDDVKIALCVLSDITI